jgi:energy-coupling factor transporter transmembrane protein EcfT
MFWILEIFPHWFWWLLLLAGFSAYFLSHLVPLKTYQLPVKIFGGVVVLLTIFIMGLLYANGVWQQAAKDLQHKVEVAEAKSQQVNEVIKERVVNKIQIVKQRGEATTEYITREVVKHDGTCHIPQEFVTAHNMAAKAPK